MFWWVLRDFKSQLTIDYIKMPKSRLKTPHEKYSFIDQVSWNRFVESHKTHGFLAKSQGGNENRAKIIYLHRLSREGYDKRRRQWLKKKRKQREQESGDPSVSLDRNSSPPSCHEKWNKEHRRPGGEFTSHATRIIAYKILSRLFFQHYQL